MDEHMAHKSGELVQTKHGDAWIAIQAAEGMPSPIIMPTNPLDPSAQEWQEVQCCCIVSRKPEHKHIKFPDPPLHYPLPKDWQPIPVQTDCVFWYRGAFVILDAVEIFDLSLKGSARAEILRRLKQQAEMEHQK